MNNLENILENDTNILKNNTINNNLDNNMDILLNSNNNNYTVNDLENYLNNNSDLLNQALDKSQNDFLNSNLMQAIDRGLDIGIKLLLPDFIEDQALDLKDYIMEHGVSNDIKNTVESIVSITNSLPGDINNCYKSINEVKEKVNNEEMIDKVFVVIEDGIKGLNNQEVNTSTKNKLEDNSSVIKESIENNVDETFDKQLKNFEKLEKYISNWKDSFKNQDFSGMQKEYYKMNTIMKELMPLEETINQYRYVENMQKLIKNNNKSFDLTEEQKELAEKLFSV